MKPIKGKLRFIQRYLGVPPLCEAQRSGCYGNARALFADDSNQGFDLCELCRVALKAPEVPIDKIYAGTPEKKLPTPSTKINTKRPAKKPDGIKIR